MEAGGGGKAEGWVESLTRRGAQMGFGRALYQYSGRKTRNEGRRWTMREEFAMNRRRWVRVFLVMLFWKAEDLLPSDNAHV